MTVTPQTILVVEDDDFLVGALQTKLEQQNFNVIQANDGEQGLDLALIEKPKLILADIMMPLMDGIEMVRRLRQEVEWGHEVPVIFVTNIGSPGRRDEAESLGAEYVVKANVSLAELVEKVDSRLGWFLGQDCVVAIFKFFHFEDRKPSFA